MSFSDKRKQLFEQSIVNANKWYNKQKGNIYIKQQKEKRGVQMFQAVGKDSLKIYVVEKTKALVFQKLKEKYPDTVINKAVFPEALFIRETKK